MRQLAGLECPAELEAVRAPLMGAPIAPHTYSFLAIMALVGWGLVFSLFAVTRRRIVHYL